MAFLTDADRTRIEAAVAAAERQTSAEFVTVIASAADDYLHVPILAAAALAFLLSGLCLLLPLDFSHVEFYAGQVALFIGAALILQWQPVRMALVPRREKVLRARRLAHEQFLELGLSSTKDRTGVMLFVAVGERYVEVLADGGVHAHVGAAVWERIIADFTRDIRAGRIADGFVQAIEACADAMAGPCPWRGDDRNELPNRLVEL
jgi:putative membrane protein